jgi:alkanesulfonate monooxygenase SsuD/methylene tetrahydromethanopterin reductase-like flavin-dependent oxidoreductase (luciferase family)
MQFGLLLMCQHPRADDMAQRLDEHLEQTRLARIHGFDAVFGGDHFLTDSYQGLHLGVFLGRVAAEAGDMRVGAGIMLLALRNPVDAADMAATLDVVTGGRSIFGVGLGYREVEFAAAGLTSREAPRRLEIHLEAIRRLWSGKRVTFQGPGFSIQDAMATVLPIQRPAPPIWMAANSHRAVQRAARLADTWYMNPHARLETLEEQLALYRATREEIGKPMPAILPLLREVYVAETRPLAQERARPYLAAKYESYLTWGQDKALPADDPLAMPFEQLTESRFIMGTPDDVIRGIELYEQRLGVNFVTLRLQWPGMPHADVVKAIGLIGGHVIPHFKARHRATNPR